MIGLWECGMLRIQPMTNMLNVYRFTMLAAERLAESLDAEFKRWSIGKEGNLRALLSTLQYILGPGSDWQPISLTDIIMSDAVKKAYRKATLHVHPDKLQQQGASIREKYICEKVFDLLKVCI
ncbi:hypothetical protein DCAR_0623590 [Daucus carota subsp. sativus]|uniref:J domain-containing protein n=1 Tax=Daucus carota subsp. sativus TaxID=79200 RepID=A0A161ZTR0_DAUCS|nr:hypothetical protein DCAR_0623590 [Daucus carota subsp. sativus]